MAATGDEGGKPTCRDPAKAVVMAYVQWLVRGGLARISKVDNGIIEVILLSGEVFHLGETCVTRIL